MKTRLIVPILGLFLFACNPFIAKHDEFPEMASIPEDEAPHYKNSLEWWYFTGFLKDQEGNEYGIEYVFFNFYAKDRREHYMVNIAVSDPQHNIFYYDYDFFKDIGRADDTLPLNFNYGTYALNGSEGNYKLNGKMEKHSVSFDLNTKPTKDVILHSNTGYENYGNLAKAGYISHTRLQTIGVININGEDKFVNGELWYDRQWNCGSVMTKDLSWDWMAISFDQMDEELMVYAVNSKKFEKTVYGGSYFSSDNVLDDLGVDDLTLEPIAYWTSPESKRIYPVKWKINVPKKEIDLTLEAVFPEQELIIKKRGVRLPYWEGMCSVKGTVKGENVTGKAYLEMTNRPKK